MKIIYSGLESSGKSLKLAKVVRSLVVRNSKWNRKYKKNRFIASNLEFSQNFNDWALSKDVFIKYWQNLDDLTALVDCDVIIDEVGNYFDSRGWESLSLDVRRWLTQGAKVGIEIYGSAQDFAQVDKSFRRLTNELYHITKIMGSRRPSATKPPIKTIWGLCMIKKINPQGYDEETSKFKSLDLIPSFFIIEKEDCEMFNTSQIIKKSKPLKYKHEVKYCSELTCNFKRELHT